ncbi:MAG: iron-containing alcohol dehydrogenase [Kiritimatiellae bacterium]|nr:iron-containing alcohol dehydrogenase [Kiritimatiellia bacterium]
MRKKDADSATLRWTESGETVVKTLFGLFDGGGAVFAQTIREATGSSSPRIFLVADSNVVQKTASLGVKIGKTLSAAGFKMAAMPVIIAGGERVKDDGFATLKRIMTAVLEAKLTPGDVLLAIGGGTILDVAAYAAAQTRGGVKFAFVPTTIAAAADAALMSAAALDASGVKDALRVKCRPAAVFIDASFYSTLLDGVWRGGMGELVRHAAARNPGLMEKIVACAPDLKARNLDVAGEIVKETVFSRIKNGASGFGLWAAHRLEAMSAFRLPHGYAVPMGMRIDIMYGVKAGILAEDDAGLICGTLEKLGAFEGFSHSHHILGRIDAILRGLDSWRLSGGVVEIPCAPGKTGQIAAPDRAIYTGVLEETLAFAQSRAGAAGRAAPAAE